MLLELDRSRLGMSLIQSNRLAQRKTRAPYRGHSWTSRRIWRGSLPWNLRRTLPCPLISRIREVLHRVMPLGRRPLWRRRLDWPVIRRAVVHILRRVAPWRRQPLWRRSRLDWPIPSRAVVHILRRVAPWRRQPLWGSSSIELLHCILVLYR